MVAHKGVHIPHTDTGAHRKWTGEAGRHGMECMEGRGVHIRKEGIGDTTIAAPMSNPAKHAIHKD